jgi:hypothetical protein
MRGVEHQSRVFTKGGSEVKIDQTINKTQGNECSVLCTKCTGKTWHIVLVSADVRGTETGLNEKYHFGWAVDHQIIQCLGCKRVSFRCLEIDSAMSGPTDESLGIETLFPPRIDGVKDLDDGIYDLPSAVGRIYKETLMALANQAPVLAAIGIRALVEAVCKEKRAEGGDLLQRIERLVKMEVLTPANASALQKIRTLGNQAAHEVKPHSNDQLHLAMEVLQHLLKDVYILPEQIASRFKT